MFPSGSRRQSVYQRVLDRIKAFAPKPDSLIKVVIKRLERKLGALKEFEVVSLGCGVGITESGFPCRSITGIDIYPYHAESVGKGYLDRFIEYDIRKVADIISEKQFDIVLCLDIIEHLEKEEGLKLVEDSERIARKAVIFYTPLKWFTNEASMDSKFWSHDNPFCIHKSLWTVQEFETKGYEIYLTGYEVDYFGWPDKKHPVGLIALKVL